MKRLTKETLITKRRSLKRKYSSADKKSKNTIVRLMKTKGAAVRDFLELFPGNSYIDYVYTKHDIQKLRKKLNP